MFQSWVRYNSSSRAVEAGSNVLENVTNAYSMFVFRQSFSTVECERLKSFLENSLSLQKQIEAPENFGPKERVKILEEEANKDPSGAALFQHLLGIEKDVMSYPITDLMTPSASEQEVPKMVARCKERVDQSEVKNVNEEIVSRELFIAEKSLIEKLDASQKQKIDALDLDKPKPSTSPQKTYIEKMIGKSRDGFNEL